MSLNFHFKKNVSLFPNGDAREHKHYNVLSAGIPNLFILARPSNPMQTRHWLKLQQREKMGQLNSRDGFGTPDNS